MMLLLFFTSCVQYFSSSYHDIAPEEKFYCAKLATYIYDSAFVDVQMSSIVYVGVVGKKNMIVIEQKCLLMNALLYCTPSNFPTESNCSVG